VPMDLCGAGGPASVTTAEGTMVCFG